jgi:hypothetical protein
MIKRAAKNLIDNYSENGAQSVQDWEVEELIEWTNSLNYDE